MLRTAASRALHHGRFGHPITGKQELAMPRNRLLFSSRPSSSARTGTTKSANNTHKTPRRKISSTCQKSNSLRIISPSAASTSTSTSTANAVETTLMNLDRKAILPLLGNFSYVALASGFLMTDMLDLRLLLVGGYTGLVAFHGLHERPLKIPLLWSSLFVLVNAMGACYLMADRYVNFDQQWQEAFYEEHFERYMTRGQFQQLMTLAQMRQVEAGTTLTREKIPSGSMYFLLKGRAQIFHGTGEDNVATIEQGGFVNDVAFQQVLKTPLEKEVVVGGAYGTVVTTEDCQVLVWDIAALKKHMGAKPEMERGMNYCMSDHLVKSLLRQRDAKDARLGIKSP